MTTAVVKHNVQLPAHLQSLVGQYTGGGAAGGIRTASYPRSGRDGGKFFLVKDGTKQLINDPANPAVPLMVFNAVIVGWSPTLTKTYYSGDYNPGDVKEPDCSSEDGVTPDEHIENPQSASCNGCPMNEWGSAVSRFSGKKTKACEDSKRVAILPTVDLSMFAMGLSIKPASLKNWSEYVKQLEGMGVALWMVETQITFDYTVSFPKLKFAMSRFLTKEELDVLAARGELTKHGLMSEEINGIVRPRGVMSAIAGGGHQVHAPAPVAVTAAPAPVVQTQAAPAPQPVPQSVAGVGPAGIPPAAPAPAFAFGGGAAPAPAGAPAPGFAFGAPSAPAANAPAPAQVPPPFVPGTSAPVPAPTPDWTAGLPDAVVASVNALGGPETDMGKQIIAMARAQAGAAETAKPAKSPRKKGESAPPAPPPPAPASSAPASPAPAAIAFPPAPGAVPSPSAPAPQANPAPGMAVNLADMLKNALGG